MQDWVFGALFFDVPEVHQQGWMSLQGQEPVRVQGTHTIPDNYCLITNLDFIQMKNSGLAPHRFFNRDWFARRMDPMLLEFALHKEEIAVQVQFFSHLFYSTMQWIDKLLSIKDPHPFGMTHTIRDFWDVDTQGQTPFQVLEAARNAIHFYKRTENISGALIEATSTMYLPRVHHALSILNSTLPKPGVIWRRMHKSSYPKRSEEIPRWVSSHRPMLVQTIIRSTLSSIHHLINPGGDLKKGNAPRLWHSSDEISYLSHFSKIEIVDAWECTSDFVFLKDEFDFLNNFTEDQMEAAYVSPAFHMFLEGLWKSATVCKPAVGEEKFTPPHSAFIRSLDMLKCMNAAVHISDMEIKKNRPWADVVGFGSGGLRIASPVDPMERDTYLSKLAWSFNLYPPMPESLVFSDFSDDHLLTYDGLVRSLYLSKDRGALMEADRESLELFS